jgi:hypothetical protein
LPKGRTLRCAQACDPAKRFSKARILFNLVGEVHLNPIRQDCANADWVRQGREREALRSNRVHRRPRGLMPATLDEHGAAAHLLNQRCLGPGTVERRKHDFSEIDRQDLDSPVSFRDRLAELLVRRNAKG